MLQEIRVTPEMRARLAERIRREAAQGSAARPWWAMLSAAVVAAAFLLVVGSAALRSAAPPAASPAEVPPVAERQRPADAGDTIPLTGVNPATVTLKAQVRDDAGNALTYSVRDAGGAPVAPAPSGIPGVEARPGQQIVLNADYTLAVSDAQGAMQSLQEMAIASGGYVVEATLNQGEDGSWGGRLLLRIPSERFSEAIARVAGAGTVKHQRLWSQDVTDQHTDLESRLNVLQAHEQKLQELALKAANFEEWLRLAQEINAVRTQVEKLQGSLKQLANQVAYATLNIGLVQPPPGAVAVPKGEGLGPQMRAAFTGTLANLGSLGRSFLIGLAGAAPVALPAMAVAVWFWLRLRRRMGSR
jgi:hypothetical protein